MKKKVVIVSPVHIFNDVRVFEKEAKSLVNLGFDVELFARTPEGIDHTESGILIHAVKYRNRIERFLKLPLLFFRILKSDASLYHLHNPDTIPFALLLKVLGKKVIYDTHEDFSKKILLRQWIPRLLRNALAKIIDSLEIIVSKVVDGTIVTQTEQKNKFKNCFVIPNAPIYRMIGNEAENKKTEQNMLTLGYLGGISKDRGLWEMLKLTRILNESINTKLVLIGGAVNDGSLSEAMKSSLWDNVEYLGKLPQSEAFAHIKNVDFGLIILEDVADYRYTSPNKIYEYMMLGVPFVATDFPAWKSELASVNSGIFLKNVDLDDAADQITKLKKDPERYESVSQNGVKYVSDEFNWDAVCEPILSKIYFSIVC